MGFRAWVTVAHGDGRIHIAASRIRIDGSVVSDKYDWTLSERVVRDIERKFGLETVKPSHLLNHDKARIQQMPNQGAVGGIQSPRSSSAVQNSRATVDGLLTERLSATDFEGAKLDVIP